MQYLLPLQQFAQQVNQRPDTPYLHQPENRQWRTLTWSEVDNQARRIATGLQAQGLNPGDRVGILSKNCAEWFIVDLAIMMAGMISVPIYSTAGEDTIRYVLEHSETKLLFVGKLDSLDAIQTVARDGIPVISFPYPTIETSETWNDWLGRYEPLAQVADPQPQDTLSIIYTSGSTGNPKGVVMSYDNVASSSDATALQLPSSAEDRFMSYLPLAHITERCVVEGSSWYSGCQIFFTESLATFKDDLIHAKPTIFISVPRLWAKFQAGILEKIPNPKLQKMLSVPILGKLVAKKIRKGLGLDQARSFGSGSAPIAPSILEWFHRLGIPIGEGWGMTETAALASANTPFEYSALGTIGKPVSCVEMKISDEGEILIRGKSVFKEYYRNPEVTAESFIDDWFRTGDCGEITADGDFKITGRIKEQFKTAKGKYVAPVPIESLIASNADIDQICVLGSGRKQPLAVVIFNPDVQNQDRETLRQALQATLDEVNSQLESHQTLDHIVVASESWTIDNGLLTPTLKIKRNLLEQRYSALLEDSLPAPVVWEDELG